jgi:hypothetical protein
MPPNDDSQSKGDTTPQGETASCRLKQMAELKRRCDPKRSLLGMGEADKTREKQEHFHTTLRKRKRKNENEYY